MTRASKAKNGDERKFLAGFKELEQTSRFFTFIQSVTSKHFEISEDLRYVNEIGDGETYKAYIRELLIEPRPSLTNGQTYLRSLTDLVEAPLAIVRAYRRMRRLKVKTHIASPHAALEECAKIFAMEAYHFLQRIKEHGNSVYPLVVKPISVSSAKVRISQIIKKFQKSDARVLQFRNFLVHGPRNRCDEFQTLRNSSLAAIIYHSDLWLNYKNDFEEAREDWLQIAEALLSAIDVALMEIQNLNETLIEAGDMTFAAVPQK